MRAIAFLTTRWSASVRTYSIDDTEELRTESQIVRLGEVSCHVAPAYVGTANVRSVTSANRPFVFIYGLIG